VQKAEDSGYLVKYLLNGNNGTPFKDMLRTVTRTLRSTGSSPKELVRPCPSLPQQSLCPVRLSAFCLPV
jgi:hypothetical protein